MFARFSDDIELYLHRDLVLGGCGRDGGDVHDRECYLLPQLNGICTFRSSSVLDQVEFQFLALAVQKIIADVSPFLANNQLLFLGVAVVLQQ